MEFCDISSRNELAVFLKIQKRKLSYILYVKGIENCYHTFEIPKKSGGTRIISAPTDDLKFIQRRLAFCLYEYQNNIHQESNHHLNVSHAFEKNKGIISNADIHKNKLFVYNIDLKDFFDSFHFGRVQGFFIKNKHFSLPYEVATVIAQLTCYNGRLPQGALTSPIITNLICQILDMRILKLAKKYKLDYSRYADDLTFSTNNKKFSECAEDFYNELNVEIVRAGFEINCKKVHMQYNNSRQTVTGLIVNQKVNINHDYYKKVRSMAHNLYTKGEFFIDGQKGTINQLEGMFSFVDYIDKHNNKKDNCSKNVYKLNSREQQFQKFLIYKYFFANPKPIIVTEGKTDIVYIKAALKNLYKEYPNLIEKNNKDEYICKIDFLKRTDRLKYFWDLKIDGADSITDLYKNFLSDIDYNKSLKKKYISFFAKTSDSSAKNPVILLFDNEDSKEKPLQKFIHSVKLSDTQKFEIINNQFTLLNDNIFIATNPKIGADADCEIECLFSADTLSHEINGLKFTRNSKFNTDECYGKEIFSKYVKNNYQTIDFSNFRLLLNVFSEIIDYYYKKR